MSKLVDYLIDSVRESTENEEFDSNTGLTEEEVLKFLNQAQYRLHSRIVSAHPQVFTKEYSFTATAGTESYDLEHDTFLSNKITNVEYSSTGLSDDYVKLDRISPHNRRSGAEGNPDSYFTRSDKIYLKPTPTTSTGTLRVTSTRRIKGLDKRRGTVQAVTIASSVITNLEINYVNGTTVDSTELGKRTRVTVVDKYGTIKMDNILLSSIASSTTYDATLAIDSSFTHESGETITVGDYVLSGDYATTHSELGPEVERYLETFAEWKMLKRDSSVDSAEAFQELRDLESDIIDSYAEISDDVGFIPNINNDGDWW